MEELRKIIETAFTSDYFQNRNEKEKELLQEALTHKLYRIDGKLFPPIIRPRVISQFWKCSRCGFEYGLETINKKYCGIIVRGNGIAEIYASFKGRLNCSYVCMHV